MTKKVSKTLSPGNTSLELGRVYKVTTYVFMSTEDILGDVDFFVSESNTQPFVELRQTVESKPVTDEF